MAIKGLAKILIALRELALQNEPKWGKSLCHEVVSEFFATKHLIHPIGP
jgi:hypothetical protein